MVASGVNFTLIGHVTKGKLQIDGEHFGFIKEVKNLYNEALGKHLDN
jgi:phosphoribosylformylglycinamidine synthase